MTANGDKRNSRALEPTVITDPDELAEAEARNGLRQYDLGIRAIQAALQDALEHDRPFKLRPSLLQSLHREALRDISMFAGLYRPGPVEIEKSRHRPPDAHLVSELVEEMCDYVNETWATSTAIHLGAYVMWRLNWIHPFADGNGRTSRISSYVILSIRSGFVLPGTPTIPEQIVKDRVPYFDALDDADAKYRDGTVDVSKMEELLDSLLAHQLLQFHRSAGGKVT
jgi:Fic family protein